MLWLPEWNNCLITFSTSVVNANFFGIFSVETSALRQKLLNITTLDIASIALIRQKAGPAIHQ